MDTTILAWNIPNWITVLLMVALGYLAVALITTLAGGKGSFGPLGQLPGALGFKQQTAGAQVAQAAAPQMYD